jgi:hypothetical protein
LVELTKGINELRGYSLVKKISKDCIFIESLSSCII